jgi:hypothetical protein
MQILAHRGFWTKSEEKNTYEAFQRSFLSGFGVETDIRDYKGELVISHDIASDECMLVTDFFELYNRIDSSLPLALNIKSDGLQNALQSLIKKHQIRNFFLFDMSIPDLLVSLRCGLPVFTRESEFEKELPFYTQSLGVWIDEFENHWIDEKTIQKHIQNDKIVCIVSPELHQRSYLSEWEEYRKIQKSASEKIMICTDFPEKARLYFNEEN